MRLGPLALTSNLFLSPLAGYTNLPFRITVRACGGVGLATTDLINARSLVEKNRTALKMIETCPEDEPLAVQLFGSVPEEMRDAAALVAETGVASIDINMGCPVRKVCRVGGGSAMMTELKKTARLVRGMVDAVRIPVTAKMRLGWDAENLTAPDLARALEDAGVAAIFVHGRTRAQGFSGRVDLAGIRAVVQAVRSIPVVGNGDVTTPGAAREMLEFTGCAGVSIGRGAFYNPWIFGQTVHYLATGELLPEPDFDQRAALMCEHFERTVRFFGEEIGCRVFRKAAVWHAKRFGPASYFKVRVPEMKTREEFFTILGEYRVWRERFLDGNGQLRARYRPPPLQTAFNHGESSEAEDWRREGIPVPKGPVERW